jgi:hypothetical protein
VATNLEKTLPLSEAIFRFASKRERQALSHDFDAKNRSLLAQNPSAEQLPRIIPELIGALIKPGAEAFALCKGLSNKVIRGELLAFGVRTKPYVATAPELIPAFIFENAKFDLRNNAIENAGNRFELVKIRRRSRGARTVDAVENDITAGPDLLPSPKKVGRPSNKDKLIEIVRDLRMQGELDGVIKKEKIHRIRCAARLKYADLFPTDKQPSEQSIREALQIVNSASH